LTSSRKKKKQPLRQNRTKGRNQSQLMKKLRLTQKKKTSSTRKSPKRRNSLKGFLFRRHDKGLEKASEKLPGRKKINDEAGESAKWKNKTKNYQKGVKKKRVSKIGAINQRSNPTLGILEKKGEHRKAVKIHTNHEKKNN